MIKTKPSSASTPRPIEAPSEPPLTRRPQLYALYARFDRLLTTYTLRPRALLGQGTRNLDRSPREMERRFGDGRYAEREALLHATLKRLNNTGGRVDFDATFEILAHARVDETIARLGRAKMLADRDERIEPELWLRGRLIRAIDAYRKHQERWDLGIRDADGSDLFSLLDGLRASLPGGVKAPRLDKGRPGRFVIARRAMRDLGAAGVPLRLTGFAQAILRLPEPAPAPHNPREALVMAVGLVDYRTRADRG